MNFGGTEFAFPLSYKVFPNLRFKNTYIYSAVCCCEKKGGVASVQVFAETVLPLQVLPSAIIRC